MKRRSAAKKLLAAISASLFVRKEAVAEASTITSTPTKIYPLTLSESVSAEKPKNLAYPPGNVLRWGADSTGSADSTAAIQSAMNIAWASGYYNSPWSGAGGATPVIVFPPGRYRVSDSVVIPTGVTVRGEAHPANTTNHTRIMMDSGPSFNNRNKAIFRFNRATMNNAALMNTAVTSTIEDLEFWFVTENGSFEAPMADGITFGKYPDGAALLFDVDAADFRVVNCVFQHAPAAIRVQGVSLSVAIRPDGWAGKRGVGIFIENCEFDAGCTHVYATSSYLDMHFTNCQFFGAMHRYERCTGQVIYQAGRWHGSAFVDAATVSNSFQRFALKSADIEMGEQASFLSIDRANLVDISQNSILGGTSQGGWLDLANANGGCVVANAINNSGSKVNSESEAQNTTAAIKLRGCRNVLVATNNITATDGGTYGGFGILTTDDRRESMGNFINGNAVTAPYGGSRLNNKQQSISAAAHDIVGTNHTL